MHDSTRQYKHHHVRPRRNHKRDMRDSWQIPLARRPRGIQIGHMCTVANLLLLFLSIKHWILNFQLKILFSFHSPSTWMLPLPLSLHCSHYLLPSHHNLIPGHCCALPSCLLFFQWRLDIDQVCSMGGGVHCFRKDILMFFRVVHEELPNVTDESG